MRLFARMIRAAQLSSKVNAWLSEKHVKALPRIQSRPGATPDNQGYLEVLLLLAMPWFGQLRPSNGGSRPPPEWLFGPSSGH